MPRLQQVEITTPRDITGQDPRDTRFTVASGADRSNGGAWIFSQGDKGQRITNVEIIDNAIEADVHDNSHMIEFIDCVDLVVNGLLVSGAGQFGVRVENGRHLHFSDIEGTRCFAPFKVDTQKSAGPTHDIKLFSSHFYDSWKGVSSGFNMHGVDGALVDDVTIDGNILGCKFTACRNIRFRNSNVPLVAIQGTANADGTNPSRHWMGDKYSYNAFLEGVTFDKSFSTFGIASSNGIQCSLKFNRIRVENCTLIGNVLEEDRNVDSGHAIQAASGAVVHVVGGSISAWNGLRGGLDAAAFDEQPFCVDPLGIGGKITQDGTTDFTGQEKVWSDRSTP